MRFVVMGAIPLWLQNITFSLFGEKSYWHAPQKPSSSGSYVSGAHAFITLYWSRMYRLHSIPQNCRVFLYWWKWLTVFWWFSLILKTGVDLTSHGLIAMWNIFGFFVVIRGLPTFFLIFFFKEKMSSWFCKRRFFPFFISPSNPALFFFRYYYFLPWWIIFLWCQKYISQMTCGDL